MASLANIDRIGEINAQKLSWAGVETTESLLEKGSTRRDRLVLAGETGLSSKRILEWVQYIDLFRINGVAEDYAELLEAVDVHSINDLAYQDPELLAERINRVNEEKQLVQRQPSLKVVKRWVKEAKQLPKIIEPD